MPIDTPFSNPLYSLLSLPPTSPNIKSFLSTDLSPTISKISEYTYYAYKPLGLSFCYIKEGDELTLDAIDVHNGTTKDGFHPYSMSHDLPCGLKGDMRAFEIVTLLGEPDRKGGGGTTRISCWIEYTFNNENKASGIIIQLHGFEWEDREMGWTSFTLY